nr:hypothetical protein [Candidatus Sigynarchaeota archaeon]
MIIDTHSQLWNEEAFQAMPDHMKAGYLAVFGSDFAGPKLEDEIKDMDEAGVDKAVIVAIDAET